jgi:GT2 family glycosyltransferase
VNISRRTCEEAQVGCAKGRRIPLSNSPDVLVVSYRRADQLASMLESVARFLPRSRVRIWDNYSDGSAAIAELATKWPKVDWHFHDDNIGFAAAVNALMRTVGSPQALLLNPDAELLSDLAISRSLLESSNRVAAVGPWIDHGGSSRPWDNARREPTPLRLFMSYAGWDQRLGRRPAFSMLYDRQPRFVSGYLSGACLLIATAAWAELGQFDERYFLYSEEADWCRRARMSGWRLLAVAEPGARHQPGGTVRDDPSAALLSASLLRRSQVRYLSDHHGALRAAAYLTGTQLLDRLQPARRRARKESLPHAA